jgi:hypothetical protein
MYLFSEVNNGGTKSNLIVADVGPGIGMWELQFTVGLQSSALEFLTIMFFWVWHRLNFSAAPKPGTLPTSSSSLSSQRKPQTSHTICYV